MNKRIILTAVLFLFTVTAAFAQQYDSENDFEVEIIDNGRAVKITEYKGNKTTVRIPPRIKNLTVTVIGGWSFYNVITNVEITSVVIPNSVTTIEIGAFSENKLNSINIPNSVTSIGNGAFRNNQLTNIIIPNSVTTIGSRAFARNKLASITIPNSVTIIGDEAFAENRLSNVRVPPSVTSLGKNAFATAQQLALDELRQIAEIKFLNPNDTAAIQQHENTIKGLQDRNNITRAELETFYRNNIRAFIADIVNEEFNKISFQIRINQQTSYYCFLIRQVNNHYVLSYESYFGTDTYSTKELSAQTLDALSSAMSRSGDFSADAINTVKAQAQLMPAVTQSASVRDELVNLITAFYLNPGKNTAEALQRKYFNLWHGGDRAQVASDSFAVALYRLSPGLMEWVDIYW